MLALQSQILTAPSLIMSVVKELVATLFKSQDRNIEPSEYTSLLPWFIWIASSYMLVPLHDEFFADIREYKTNCIKYWWVVCYAASVPTLTTMKVESISRQSIVVIVVSKIGLLIFISKLYRPSQMINRTSLIFCSRLLDLRTGGREGWPSPQIFCRPSRLPTYGHFWCSTCQSSCS